MTRLKEESPVSGAEQGKPPATFHNEDTITQAKAALKGTDE